MSATMNVRQTQAAHALRGTLVHLEVGPGYGPRPVWWGHTWQIGTAAFWAELTAQAAVPNSYRLGACLAHEVTACVLGGYGMPAGLADAAYRKVREQGWLEAGIPADERSAGLTAALTDPLRLGTSRRRYRFPRQRAHRIAQALAYLEVDPLVDPYQRAGNAAAGQSPIPTHGRSPQGPARVDLEMDTRAVRNWLLAAPGIGPKTASWVMRNHFGATDVAIVDVHIRRAGVGAGVFNPSWVLPRHYNLFETAFLGWADVAAVSPAHLDACIWGVLAHGWSSEIDALRDGPVWPVTDV